MERRFLEVAAHGRPVAFAPLNGSVKHAGTIPFPFGQVFSPEGVGLRRSLRLLALSLQG